MSAPPRSRSVLGAALVAAVLATVLRLGVDAEVLLWCAPALLLAAPLIVGRFVGEDAIDARRHRRAAPRPRRVASPVKPPHGTPRAARHRGRLIALRLAERGPPAARLAA
jgi:hypothetical protein